MKMNREGNIVPLNDMLARLTKGWRRDREYNLNELKQQWSRVAREPWMHRVVPRNIEDCGCLVVEVPTSSTVRMELQRRGDRWQRLLVAVQEVCTAEITDLVVENPMRRTGRQ